MCSSRCALQRARTALASNSGTGRRRRPSKIRSVLRGWSRPSTPSPSRSSGYRRASGSSPASCRSVNRLPSAQASQSSRRACPLPGRSPYHADRVRPGLRRASSARAARRLAGRTSWPDSGAHDAQRCRLRRSVTYRFAGHIPRTPVRIRATAILPSRGRSARVACCYRVTRRRDRSVQT